jgi:hypothetical protein
MNESIAARLKELEDKESIADCLRRFFRGTDVFDAKVFASAFHADAKIKTPVGEFSGDSAYAEFAVKHHSGLDAWRSTFITDIDSRPLNGRSVVHTTLFWFSEDHAGTVHF